MIVPAFFILGILTGLLIAITIVVLHDDQNPPRYGV